MTECARPCIQSLLAIHMVPAFKPGHVISNGRLCAPTVKTTGRASWPDLMPPRVSAPVLLRATELMT